MTLNVQFSVNEILTSFVGSQFSIGCLNKVNTSLLFIGFRVFFPSLTEEIDPFFFCYISLRIHITLTMLFSFTKRTDCLGRSLPHGLFFIAGESIQFMWSRSQYILPDGYNQ